MKYKLEDLIDIDLFQYMQDRLNEICPFPSAIIDNEGNVLTATAWQDICTNFHRQNKDTEQLCIQSDIYIKDHLHEADPYVSYRCPHGLVDNAIPIIINGTHYANFFTGQFFMEEPDLDFFKKQAKKYGFDEKEYIEAVKSVPILNKEQLDSFIYLIEGLITLISESGLKRLQEIENSKLIIENKKRFQSTLETCMDGFCLTDNVGNIIEVNDSYCNMSGYSKDELTSMNISDLELNTQNRITYYTKEKFLLQQFERFESKHYRKDGSYFDVEVSAHFYNNNDRQCVLFIRDITESKRSKDALRIIAETSLSSEEDLFKVLVRELAISQDAKYALIAILDESGENTASTVTVWNDGEYTDNFSYSFDGTPCYNVLKNTQCFYPSDVQNLFPDNILLNEMGVDSYWGAPLINSSGKTIGLIALLDDKPMRESPQTLSLLKSFAARASTKIERSNAQKIILRNEERLRCFANIMEKETNSLKNFLDNAVDEIVALTKSAVGYLYFYNEETEQFKLHSYSKKVLDKCDLGQRTFYNLEETGIWSQPVKERKALILNNFEAPNPAKKGFPKGHINLNRYMTIPVLHSNKIVAVVGVGNKLSDYTASDVEQLTLLMDSVWKVVEQKIADEKLKISEEKLKSVLKGAKIGFWEIDLESRKISADPHAFKIIGLIEYDSDFSVEYFYSQVHPRDENTVRQVFAESIEKCKPVAIECRLRNVSGGWKWVSIKGKPLIKEGQILPSIFAGLISDIDQRVKAEESVLYSKMAAEESNRLKTEFLSNVSHELRTPLTAVIGFSEILLEQESSDSNVIQREYIENINQSGQNLLNVVSKMLDFSETTSNSNIDYLELQSTSVSNLLSHVRNLLSSAAKKKGITIDTAIMCSTETYALDVQKIQTILYNLLENAIKFTGENGCIQISVECNETVIQFSIIDNGIGIAEENFEKIFDPFVQIDGSSTRKYGGTGLGLALTKRLIQLHGGEIRFESEVGKGSNFSFMVPIQ